MEKAIVGRTLESLIQHRMRAATDHESGSGRVPGWRYKRRYTSHSIIGSVRYSPLENDSIEMLIKPYKRAQQGLQYLVCVCACMFVCLSIITGYKAKSDTNGLSAMQA